jgi:hypothetical protein
MATARGIDPFLKATLPTRVLRRRGLSLHRRAPGPSPYDTGAGSHTSCKPARNRRSQTAARGACNRPAVTSTPPSSPKPAVERADRHAGGVQPHHGGAPSTSTHPAWRPRPIRHVTGAPVTTCEKLYRHLRQSRAFSTAEPVPRLEATLRVAQQCQPSTSITGQSAAGGGATVDMAKSGPAVMAAADGRKRRSNRLQAHVPSWGSRGALSHGVKTTRPCSVPRTARVTTAPRTTHPVALIPRQGKRRLWQAKRATFHLRHDDRVKKGAPHHLNSYPFSLPLSLSLATGTEKEDISKGILLREGSGPRALLLIRGSKAGPSERFDSRPKHSGFRLITDQRFEGWPLGRVRQPPQSTRAPRPLLIRGSKAGPSKGSTAAPEHAERGMTLGTSDTWPRLGICSRGTLGHFRDQQERFCNGIPSEGGIEPSDPIERDRVRQITCRYFWSAPLGH